MKNKIFFHSFPPNIETCTCYMEKKIKSHFHFKEVNSQNTKALVYKDTLNLFPYTL